MKPRTPVAGPALLLAAAVALAACTERLSQPLMTPLVSPDSYGYSEDWLSDDTYQVRYLGPEVRTNAIRPQWVERAAQRAEETAYDLALWRAAKLSLQRGFPAFVVTDGQVEVSKYIVGRDYTSAFDAASLNVTPRAASYYSATYLKPQVILTVEMSHELAGAAFDARGTADRIEQKFADGAPGAIAPNTYYYFGSSSFLHDYEEPGKEPAAPKPGKPPERFMPPYRSMPYVPYGPR
jgi:hypothetical protein